MVIRHKLVMTGGRGGDAGALKVGIWLSLVGVVTDQSAIGPYLELSIITSS